MTIYRLPVGYLPVICHLILLTSSDVAFLSMIEFAEKHLAGRKFSDNDELFLVEKKFPSRFLSQISS
jgi:hypothetical protein